MPELDRVNSRRGSPRSPRSPKSPKSPTLEQLIHTIETSKWSRNGPSSSSSLSPRALRSFGRNQEPEAENGHHKKSVFTKMKETAKKIQHNLSPKKKHCEEGFNSACGIKFEDHEALDEKDPEYLGAPMYESEMAPEELKETARQHPRADPVISEKNILPVPIRSQIVEENKDEPKNAMKKTTEIVPEKNVASEHVAVPKNVETPVKAQEKPDHLKPEALNQVGGQDSAWDKGVSVKQYIMQKLEPGEDERALSQVITEAISPRKASNNGGGVVGRVKGAVSSFIWTDDSKNLATARPVEHTPAEEEENHGRVLQPN